jgi:CRISP-associated protein Cas1
MSKQILFIESKKNNKIKFKNSNLILIDENNKILLQHSCRKIFLVFIKGECSVTSILIKKAKKHAVPIIFLGYNLKPYFSILPDNKGNFLLRKKQYTKSDDLKIAKHIIKNKVNNQKKLIQSLRYKSKKDKEAIKQITRLYDQTTFARDSQELLGIEGNASKTFFSTYFKNLGFKVRKPRCKTDEFNLLFDIGYYYLFNFIEANLELYGFDTYCGVYHKFFFQRKSLVCDLMEPFRCIIEKRIRKSANLKQINASDFKIVNGQYYLKREFNKKYSKLFLKEILENKEEIFLYIQKYYRAFIKEKNIDEYPVFELSRHKK